MSATSLHRHASPSQRQAVTTPPRPVIELVLSGDLDMEQADELHRYLTGGIERGCDIVIDLGDVRLIDCVCLGVLVRAAHAVHALGRTLSLLEPSKLVLMTLRLTETEDQFSIHADRAAAVRSRGWHSGDRRAE